MAVIERVEFDQDAEVLGAHVRPVSRQRGRCGVCQRRSPGYDGGPGRRRCRILDLGTVRAELEAESPRVRCRTHGVVVAAVPWAYHGAGHTKAFDDQVAWLATQAWKSMVTELMHIAWGAVGSVITRVWDDIDAVHDRFAGLRRIGIDEISYKKGHKYLMVVVDHDARAMVFRLPCDEAAEALQKWISWARRCRIPAFVKLQRSIVKHEARVLAAIEHNRSNGLIESTNTKIRLITRRAFGFKSPEALIGLAMLSLGGHRFAIPGRK